jgi:hypothetical protein
VLRHVVCLRFRTGTDAAAIAVLEAALARLPGRIPEIRAYRFGKDAGLANGNADFAVVADFDDVEGWRTYMAHPDHVRLIDEYVRPIVEQRTAAQLDLPA